MILLLLLALFQGQATNQPGVIWIFKAKPVTVYYVRLSDDTFVYQMRDTQYDGEWFDTRPQLEDEPTPIRMNTVCEPAPDKCNTICCGEYGCTETAIVCGVSIQDIIR